MVPLGLSSSSSSFLLLSSPFPSPASPSLAAAMAKQHKATKLENVGKGKVTPVQIAFIVERYLAGNNCTNTLSAFRTEASDLFSKTKSKEAPKGLLGLAEILDEYISLKEQRVMVDQEKRRVEMALQGIQDVMQAYHSAGNPALPPSPPLLPPQFIATPNIRVYERLSPKPQTVLLSLFPSSSMN